MDNMFENNLRMLKEPDESATSDIEVYAAKNVSNDFDFTKLFAPSTQPSLSPSVAFNTFASCPTSTFNVSLSEGNDEQLPVDSVNELTSYVTTFSYELVTPVDDTDLSETLEALEERILDSVASSVLVCDDGDGIGDRRLQDGSGRIVRIDSDPPDVVDEVNGEFALLFSLVGYIYI